MRAVSFNEMRARWPIPSQNGNLYLEMRRPKMEHAEELLRRGRLQAAVDAFRGLLSSDPDNAILRGRIAEAYRRASNPERALHHFKKAAVLFSQNQDPLSAVRMLEAADHVSPDTPDVLFRLAEHYKQLGRERAFIATARKLAEAAKAHGDRRRLWALEAIATADPHNPKARADWARALVEANRLEEAILQCRELGAQLPSNDLEHMFRSVIRAPPDENRTAVDLANLLSDQGLPREGLSILITAYQRSPEDIDVLASLAHVLSQVGDSERARAARIELVKLRARRGQREEALQEIPVLLAEAPRDSSSLEVAGNTYAAFGLGREAARLWFELTELHDAAGRAQERDRLLKLTLRYQPDHPGALALAARLLREAGREAEAKDLDAIRQQVEHRDWEDTLADPSDTTPPLPFPSLNVSDPTDPVVAVGEYGAGLEPQK